MHFKKAKLLKFKKKSGVFVERRDFSYHVLFKECSLSALQYQIKFVKETSCRSKQTVYITKKVAKENFSEGKIFNLHRHIYLAQNVIKKLLLA